MNLVKLTRPDGEPVVINPECVGSVEPLRDGRDGRSIVIVFGREVRVRGTQKEVVTALWGPQAAELLESAEAESDAIKKMYELEPSHRGEDTPTGRSPFQSAPRPRLESSVIALTKTPFTGVRGSA